MKKEKFLSIIQRSATTSQRVAVVWDAAVDSKENDPRWRDVGYHPDQEIMIQNFIRVFGVIVPEVTRRRRLSMVDKLEKMIATQRGRLDKITNPEWKKKAIEDIKGLERKLEKARERE